MPNHNCNWISNIFSLHLFNKFFSFFILSANENRFGRDFSHFTRRNLQLMKISLFIFFWSLNHLKTFEESGWKKFMKNIEFLLLFLLTFLSKLTQIFDSVTHKSNRILFTQKNWTNLLNLFFSVLNCVK